MTTFKDVFKKSFIEGFSRYDMTPENILIVFAISAIFSVYIFIAYRILTRKTFYSKNFNISLAIINLITAGIILTMQSNVVVSLGMVGALSIVRFRNAVKDPMDLVFFVLVNLLRNNNRSRTGGNRIRPFIHCNSRAYSI